MWRGKLVWLGGIWCISGTWRQMAWGGMRGHGAPWLILEKLFTRGRQPLGLVGLTSKFLKNLPPGPGRLWGPITRGLTRTWKPRLMLLWWRMLVLIR